MTNGPKPSVPDVTPMMIAWIESLQGGFGSAIERFSQITMGATLFLTGLTLLSLDVIFRVYTWKLGVDQRNDLLFISLLVVAVMMMAGGLVANLYLIWSLERGRTQVAQFAHDVIEQDARLTAMKAAADKEAATGTNVPPTA
jgi:hypothetical protein